MAIKVIAGSAARIAQGYTEKASCPCCTTCWKHPETHRCMYGGPYFGYSQQTERKLAAAVAAVAESVAKVEKVEQMKEEVQNFPSQEDLDFDQPPPDWGYNMAMWSEMPDEQRTYVWDKYITKMNLHLSGALEPEKQAQVSPNAGSSIGDRFERVDDHGAPVDDESDETVPDFSDLEDNYDWSNWGLPAAEAEDIIEQPFPDFPFEETEDAVPGA